MDMNLLFREESGRKGGWVRGGARGEGSEGESLSLLLHPCVSVMDG